MKWILVLIVISCGKNKTPPLDFHRSAEPVKRNDLQIKKLTLERVNGKIGDGQTLYKKNTYWPTLKIRMNSQLNTFEEKKEVAVEPLAWDCVYSIRWVSGLIPVEPLLESLVDNLVFNIDGRILTLLHPDITIQEGEDNDGIFWSVDLKAEGNKVDFVLKELPASSFKTVGNLNSNCRGQNPPIRPISQTQENNEAKFRLDIEALVEKIE